MDCLPIQGKRTKRVQAWLSGEDIDLHDFDEDDRDGSRQERKTRD